MSLLEKLKAVFNIELKKPIININISNNSNNVTKNYIYNEAERNLTINYNQLADSEKLEIKKLYVEKVEKGGKILERETSCLLDDLYTYQRSKSEDKKTLDFFKTIIPENDLEALEASLYLGKCFKEKRVVVRKLKEDIRKRFGDRGNNIANLCTAGYFEIFLMPLYNSSKEDFEKLYDVIVVKSPMAVFVHNKMDSDQITKELTKKIVLSKKYGLDFIHIHGIGEKNICSIKEWIKENKEPSNFINKDIFEKEGIIIVELIL